WAFYQKNKNKLSKNMLHKNKLSKNMLHKKNHKWYHQCQNRYFQLHSGFLKRLLLYVLM
ncbi:unnamed protein product, partial [Urochloa humidicola]